MALLPKLTDAQASPQANAVFDDIRATRGGDYINDIWRVLANDPAQLERTWRQVKATMGAGALDPLTKELIYVAISINNGCDYCINTHTASARAKGMTDAQFTEMLAVIGLASQLNKVVTGLQVELDDRYRQ